MPSKLGARVFVAGLVLLAAAWLYWRDPAQSWGFLPCVFNHLTGWYCPGCGSQRALHALLHGRVLAALSYNAALVLGLLPVAGVFAWWKWRGRWLLSGRWLVAAVAVLMAFGVLRNVPVAPFIWLAP